MNNVTTKYKNYYQRHLYLLLLLHIIEKIEFSFAHFVANPATLFKTNVITKSLLKNDQCKNGKCMCLYSFGKRKIPLNRKTEILWLERSKSWRGSGEVERELFVVQRLHKSRRRTHAEE
jgi:hypothetical protein